MKYELVIELDNTLVFRFFPIIPDKKMEFKIKQPKEGYWPVKFSTATTDIRDAIGNIVSIDKKKNRAEVKMVYRGSQTVAKNVLLKEKEAKEGQRVMVTEHINVAGGFDFLATRKRILNPQYSQLNFVNVGWSNDKESHILRIDVYTGETHLFKDKANYCKV
jgi:hypothetical protein